jgi:hypothetical protein
MCNCFVPACARLARLHPAGLLEFVGSAFVAETRDTLSSTNHFILMSAPSPSPSWQGPSWRAAPCQPARPPARPLALMVRYISTYEYILPYTHTYFDIKVHPSMFVYIRVPTTTYKYVLCYTEILLSGATGQCLSGFTQHGWCRGCYQLPVLRAFVCNLLVS